MSLPAALSAVVFDLDGTLVDSSSDLTTAVNIVLVANGGQPVSISAVKHWIGHGATHMLEHALASQGVVVEHDIYPAFRAAYRARLSRETRPYPGIVRLLTNLRRHGVKVAVCTNKPEEPALELVAQLGLSVLLDTLVGGDTFEVKKPHAKPITEALRRVDVAPEYAVMVGDSVADVGGGKAAGIATLGVSYGYGDVSGADVIVASSEDLAELLSAHLPQRS
ncbi:MAG: phosphoglycolate phosphatase [Myxococcota bacterium]|jgi:phosphoglycolate phosphatase